MSEPAFIYDIETIKKMRGGALVEYARDLMIERARWIDPNWGSESARYHDVLVGAALAMEMIVAVGKDEYEKLKPRIEAAKAKGDKPPRLHRLVEDSIEALRSGLIGEMLRREPKKYAPVEGATEAAA